MYTGVTHELNTFSLTLRDTVWYSSVSHRLFDFPPNFCPCCNNPHYNQTHSCSRFCTA